MIGSGRADLYSLELYSWVPSYPNGTPFSTVSHLLLPHAVGSFIICRAHWIGLISRVALDQLVFAPNAIALFFFVTGALEGHDLITTGTKLKQVYWDVLMSNYTIWPAVQLFNFYFIPLHYQSILVNTISVGWNAYLSRANERANKNQ